MHGEPNMAMTDHLFKARVPLMNAALDAYSLRQQVIAKNIANATSPNYRPERVVFEEEFAKANGIVARGTQSDGRHVPIGPPRDGDIHGVREDAPVPRAEVLFSGESHVNIDREMAELAQNQIRHRMSSRLLSRYFKGLQGAIKGTNQ